MFINKNLTYSYHSDFFNEDVTLSERDLVDALDRAIGYSLQYILEKRKLAMEDMLEDYENDWQGVNDAYENGDMTDEEYDNWHKERKELGWQIEALEDVLKGIKLIDENLTYVYEGC